MNPGSRAERDSRTSAACSRRKSLRMLPPACVSLNWANMIIGYDWTKTSRLQKPIATPAYGSSHAESEIPNLESSSKTSLLDAGIGTCGGDESPPHGTS